MDSSAESGSKATSKSPAADHRSSSLHGNRERKSSSSSNTSSAAQNPASNPFDPANLLGSLGSVSAAQNAAALAQMYNPAAAAFSLMGGAPYFSPGLMPFGGLGELGPGFPSPLSPSTGGAEWWRAMSEHSRRLAECGSGGSTAVSTPSSGAGMFGLGGLSTFYGGLGQAADPNLAVAAAYGLPVMPPYSGLSGMFSTSPSKTPTTTTTASSGSLKLSPASSSGSLKDKLPTDMSSPPPRSSKSSGTSSSSKYHSHSYPTTKSAIETSKNAKSANRESPNNILTSKKSNSHNNTNTLKRNSSKQDVFDSSTPSSVLGKKDKVLSSMAAGSDDKPPILDPTSLLLNNPSVFPGLFPMDPLTNTASPFYFPFGVGAGLPGTLPGSLPGGLPGDAMAAAASLAGYPYSMPVLFSSPTTTTSTYTAPVFTSVSSEASSHRDSKATSATQSSTLVTELSTRHSNGSDTTDKLLKYSSHDLRKSKSETKDKRNNFSTPPPPPVSSIAKSEGRHHRNRSPVISPPPLMSKSGRMSPPPSKTNVTAVSGNRMSPAVSTPTAIPAAHAAKPLNTPGKKSSQDLPVEAHMHRSSASNRFQSSIKESTTALSTPTAKENNEGAEVLDLSVKRSNKDSSSTPTKANKSTTNSLITSKSKDSSVGRSSFDSISIPPVSTPGPVNQNPAHQHSKPSDVYSNQSKLSSKYQEEDTKNLKIEKNRFTPTTPTKTDEKNEETGDKTQGDDGGDSKLHKDLADQHIEYASKHAEFLASAFQQNLNDYYAYMSMMPPMFDAGTGMLIPPPPPPSGGNTTNSRGGRGRGRGRGRSRSAKLATETAHLDLASVLSGSGGGGQGRGRPRGSSTRGRGRAKNVESRSLAELAMEFHRQQVEMQIQQQKSENSSAVAAAGEATTNHKLSSSGKDSNRSTPVLLQNALDDTAAEDGSPSSGTNDGKSKVTESSRLSQALGFAAAGMMDQRSRDSLDAKLAKCQEMAGESDGDLSSSESELDTGSTTGGDYSVDAFSTQDSDDTSLGHKYQDGSTALEDKPPKKRRRRTIFDETVIRIPLEHGWRRETRIREVNRKGIFGEVWYYTPCRKRLKTYLEVEKYMLRHSITDLNKENFTFSCSVNVGDFLEYRATSGDYVALNEHEVMDRFVVIEERKKRIYERQQREHRRLDRKRQALEMARRLEEVKMKKHSDHQDLARKVAEIKLKRRLERQQQKEAVRRAKYLRALELKKFRDRQKQMKLQREEQLRVERESRTQQILEDKKQKKEQQQYVRYAEMIQKAQEKEIRRQREILQREQERERRRQHILMAKALDARKKMEERERLREQKLAEKRLDRERKLEQKRVELELARRLKQSVDDMCLLDHSDMPDLERLGGVRLSGEALANCLMVLEFCINFKDALRLDKDQLPTLSMLQAGLLNQKDSMDDFMQFTTNLLALALDEPGVPNLKEAVTSSGEKITTVDITDYSITEVLRVFIRCRNGREDEMTGWLERYPYQSLNPTQKASILAFLCNEMLSGKDVATDIERNIDKINNLRRDKWEVDNELRRLKVIQIRKFKKVAPPEGISADNSHMSGDNTGISAVLDDSAQEPAVKKLKEEEQEESEEEVELLDDRNVLEGEDALLSAEELQKKIDKIIKQQNSYRTKVQDVSHKLRGIEFGQDRFRRRYWALPHCGGIYVEGKESAEVGEKLGELPADSKSDLPETRLGDDAVPDGKGVKMEGDKGINEESVKDDGDTKRHFVKGDVKRELFVTINQNMPSCLMNGNAESESHMKMGGNLKVEGGGGAELKEELNPEVIDSNQVKKEIRSPTMKLEDYPLFRMDNFKKKADIKEKENETSVVKQVNNDEVKVTNKTAINGFAKEDEIKKALRESLQIKRERALNNKKPDGVNVFCGKQELLSPTKTAMIKDGLSAVLADGCDEKLAKYQAMMKEGNDSLSPDSKMYACMSAMRQIDLKASPYNKCLEKSPVTSTPFRNINSLAELNSGNTESPILNTTTESVLPLNNLKTTCHSETLDMSNKLSTSNICGSHATAVPDNKRTVPKSNDLAVSPDKQVPSADKMQDTSNDKHITATPCSTTLIDSGNNIGLVNISSQNTDNAVSLVKMVPSNTQTVSLLKPSVVASTTNSSMNQFKPVETSSNQVKAVEASTKPIPSDSSSSGSVPVLANSILQNNVSVASPANSVLSSTYQSCFTAFATCTGMANNSGQSPASVVVVPEGFSSYAGTWFSLIPRHSCDRNTVLHTVSGSVKARQANPPATGNIHHPMVGLHPQQSGGFQMEPCFSVNHNAGAGANVAPTDRFVATTASDLAVATVIGEEQQQQMALADMQYGEAKPIPEDKSCGWWRIGNSDVAKQLFACLHPRGVRERNLHKNVKMSFDYVTQMCSKSLSSVVQLEETAESTSACDNPRGAPRHEPYASHSEAVLQEVEHGILEEIQDMEDRVCGASLQVKGYKIPSKITEDESVELVVRAPPGGCGTNQRVILDVAKERLLDIERNIERRYLKSPLCKQSTLTLNALTSIPRSGGDDTNSSYPGEGLEYDQDVANYDAIAASAPKELVMWRTAVVSASNVSQLACCLLRLQHCVAWEKSVMKVTCQICCKDDNEAELLLCDSCDKGYHTYCFKPKLEDIPDGDWYCYECISRATGESHCVSCGRRLGKMVSCEHCHRVQHLDCADPPLSRMPRKWACSACLHSGRGKSKKSRKPKTSVCERSMEEDSIQEVLQQPSSPLTTASTADAQHTEKLTQQSEQKDAVKTEEAVQEKSEKTPTKDKKKKERKSKGDSTAKTAAPLGAGPEVIGSGAGGVKPEKPKKKKKKKEKKEVCEEGVAAEVAPPVAAAEKADVYEFDEGDPSPKVDVEQLETTQQPASQLDKEVSMDQGDSTEGELEVDLQQMDLTPCRQLLSELQAHEEGWPFMKAVDTKKFPQYKKIIKKPMDFNTMMRKLKNNTYVMRSEFALDARQIFENCEVFNEDESPVGQAGHIMRNFFEKRWSELC